MPHIPNSVSPSSPPPVIPRDPQLYYRTWWLERMPWRDDLFRQRIASRTLRYQPTISIITPVYDTPPDLLDRMLRSVENQTYPRWEHCLVDDGSPNGWLPGYLARRAAADPRIKFKSHTPNRGIVGASNEALSLATGEFIAMLDHDDELTPDALYEMVKRLNEKPETDVLYSDFDIIDRGGRHHQGWFLPDWSPELLLSLPMVAHLTMYRRSIVEQVGRWRPGYDGSQDFDLSLRVSTISDRIEHVPHVLYHWRRWERSVAGNPSAKPYAFEALRLALDDHFRRNEIQAARHSVPWLGLGAVRFAIIGEPLVSAIVTVPASVVPEGCAAFVERLKELMSRGGYARTEIIFVAPPGVAAAVESACAQAALAARVLPFDAIGDASAVANAGAAAASGEYLLFLAGAMIVRDDGWLSAMLEYAQQPAIGAVGARIYLAGGGLWDAGVLLPRAVPHRMRVEYALINFSAVTSTCAMTRRTTFAEAGGFQPAETVGYPDIDYCLRLRERGYRHVVAPFAGVQLADAPPNDRSPEAQTRFAAVWGQKMQRDPYYNPNFNQAVPTFMPELRGFRDRPAIPAR